jgi:hypothetical protein
MKRAALIVLSALIAGLVGLGNASANGSEPCRGDLVRIHLGSYGGAGGQRGQAVVFTNRAHSACAVSGFPKFSAFTTIESKVRARFVTHTYLGGHPAKVVRVGPGESASILYDWQDAPSTRPGGGCVEVVKIVVGLRRELGRGASRTFRVRDDVCQGAINVLPFTVGSQPSGFDS